MNCDPSKRRNLENDLEMLTGVSALSGYEEFISKRILDVLKLYTDDTHMDYSGNVTATFNANDADVPHLLILAHTDEVGFIVRKVSDDGFLFIERSGGPSIETARAQAVEIWPDDDRYPVVSGIVGTKAHHFLSDQDKRVVPDKHELYIDIGAESRDEVLSLGIDIGSRVTFKPNFQKLGKYRVMSKTLDNRAACAVLLNLAEYLSRNKPSIRVSLAFTVQEEFNLRGSLPVQQRLVPDFVVSVDASVACDTPDLNQLYEISLGKGPAVSYYNTYGKGPAGGMIANPPFRRMIERLCRENGISYQKEVVAGVLSDTSFMQMVGENGTITAHVGFPLRYAHAATEVADLRDLSQLVQLLITLSSEDKESFENLLKGK
jgi:putative aminopeptidase FrvX